MGRAPGPAGRSFVRIDLRRDPMRAVARTSEAERALIGRRVLYGTLQGALGHEAGRDLGGRGEVQSTSGWLDDRGVVLVDSPAAARAAFPDGARSALAAAALEQGSVLVVP